jgi:hypothetical protein
LRERRSGAADFITNLPRPEHKPAVRRIGAANAFVTTQFGSYSASDLV